MAKAKEEVLKPINVVISTAITVFLAELVPALFLGTLILIQERFFGPLSEAGNAWTKATYTLQEAMKFQGFGFSLGILTAVAIMVFLSVILVDEWFYSHKLNSLKNVAILAFSWAVGFYVIDSLMQYNFQFSADMLYYGPRQYMTIILFVVPFLLFFVRRHFKNK